MRKKSKLGPNKTWVFMHISQIEFLEKATNRWRGDVNRRLDYPTRAQWFEGPTRIDGVGRCRVSCRCPLLFTSFTTFVQHRGGHWFQRMYATTILVRIMFRWLADVCLGSAFFAYLYFLMEVFWLFRHVLYCDRRRSGRLHSEGFNGGCWSLRYTLKMKNIHILEIHRHIWLKWVSGEMNAFVFNSTFKPKI